MCVKRCFAVRLFLLVWKWLQASGFYVYRWSPWNPVANEKSTFALADNDMIIDSCSFLFSFTNNPIIHWEFSVPLQWFISGPEPKRSKTISFLVRCPGFVKLVWETCCIEDRKAESIWIEMHSSSDCPESYSKALCLCKLNGLCLSFLLYSEEWVIFFSPLIFT